MGLIRAVGKSVANAVSGQWKEYYYCDAIPDEVICKRGERRRNGRGRGSDNVISNGSLIAVADGQCMLIVDQGEVVDVCSVTGTYVYDVSTEPSIFYGTPDVTVPGILEGIARRFPFGGVEPKEQRVYYINTKELMGNKYGTPNPIPYRLHDPGLGPDAEIAVRCFGEFSYRVADPVLFYTNVCGNVAEDFTRDRIDSQLRSELMTALQPAFAQLSEKGVRYSSLPAHAQEIAQALNAALTEKWRRLRGIELVSIGITSVTIREEDERMIREMQAGKQRAESGWTCECGAVNRGRFCRECGRKKPEGALLYRCDKCGWEPEDPYHPPKFCPECGDPFGGEDAVS